MGEKTSQCCRRQNTPRLRSGRVNCTHDLLVITARVASSESPYVLVQTAREYTPLRCVSGHQLHRLATLARINWHRTRGYAMQCNRRVSLVGVAPLSCALGDQDPLKLLRV